MTRWRWRSSWRCARTQKLRGRYVEARQLTDALLPRIPQQAVELRIEALRHSSTLAARAEHDRGRALRESDEALRLARGQGDPELLRATLRDRSVMLVDLGEAAAAIPPLVEVLALSRERFGANHEQVSLTLASLARARRRSGDLEGAEQDARAAVAMDRRVFAGDHWITSNHLNALSLILELRGELDEALAQAAEAMRISIATLGPNHAESLVARRVHATMLSRMGRTGRRRGGLARDRAARRTPVRCAARAGTLFAGLAGLRAGAVGDREAGALEMEAATAALDEVRCRRRGCRHAGKGHRAARTGGVGAARGRDRRGDVVRAAGACGGAHPRAGAYWRGRVETLQGEVALAAGDAAAALALLQGRPAASTPWITPAAVLQAGNRLLQARAAQALGDAAAASRLAAEGRALLARLAYPPPSLVALAQRLPG